MDGIWWYLSPLPWMDADGMLPYTIVLLDDKVVGTWAAHLLSSLFGIGA